VNKKDINVEKMSETEERQTRQRRLDADGRDDDADA